MNLAAKNAKCAKKAWPMVRLGDVCEIRAGATHHGIESETGPYPVYGSGGYICQATEYRCPANTVTVGRKGTLDKPLLIEEPFWNIDTCFGVIPNESLDARYLWRFCQNFDFYSLIPSIGRPSTNSEAIKLIQIPLPPLSVQREIVARLEKELGEADALAAKFKEIAENADAEFKAELDETFKNVAGEKVKLGDVCEIQRGGSPRPIKKYLTDAADGLNWIKIGDVAADGKYIVSVEDKIKPSGLNKTRRVRSGDFLLSNSMSFGRPYILKIDGCIHDGWLVLHGFQDKFTEDYFYYLLRSSLVQDQFDSLAHGSSVRNLNTGAVSVVEVTQTPIGAQQSIVSKLESAKLKCEKLKAAAERGLRAAEDLRKSILAEAFEQ